MFTVTRSKHNPILTPDHMNSFEAYAAFNGCPIRVGKNIALLYRAQAEPESYQGSRFSLSSIGCAWSHDRVHFNIKNQLVTPDEVWERYGCEDPRVTKIDGKYFIFYTALSNFPFNAEGIKVAVAVSDDLKTISEKHLVTPFNAKAMTLFPEKIKGKYVAILSVNTDLPPAKLAVAEFTTLEQMWDEEFWKKWYAELDKHVLEIPRLPSDQVEVGAPPIKTKDGWLFVYSHIQKYFTNDKLFGIEAVLLDLKNPHKIIGSTNGAMLAPEESYEKYGTAPNIVFPSGALIDRDVLSVYYGATDTTCAVAHVNLPRLLASMKFPHKETDFVRMSKKPILVPRPHVPWEAKAVFNPAAIRIDGTTYVLYRAMSLDNTSVIGLAETKDGVKITYRPDVPVYVPRESFEDKKVPNGNSGCEDPRLVQIKDHIYMYYTAYNGVNTPSIAVSSIAVKDFVAHVWKWSKPSLVTRDGYDDKDGCIHPEKVNGKYFLFHRVNNMICGDYGSSPSFPERNTFKNIPVMTPRPGMWDEKKVGMSVPPIKTDKGWLLLYHGISDHGTYRIGAVLLDKRDPTIILARTTDFLFEPREKYEKEGQIGNVVFPCGAVVVKDMIHMYYGAADSVINVASLSLKKLLASLT
jgi:predicted GH43/DUF377 family glycosyl hydrolase